MVNKIVCLVVSQSSPPWITGANVITLYSPPLVPMQVSDVLGACRRLMQLLILYMQLSQMTITELGLLLLRHLTVVIGSMHYPSLHVVFARKTMLFVSLSVTAWVPVCVNPTNACGNMVNTRSNHGLSCKRSARYQNTDQTFAMCIYLGAEFAVVQLLSAC